MRDYLKRLVTTGAAYQAAEIFAKGIALVTLPLYTRHVSTAGYGAYNTLLTAVILFEHRAAVGIGEAFVRFYFTDSEDRAAYADSAHGDGDGGVDDDGGGAARRWLSRRELSRLVLGFDDPLLMDCAILGLWAFTNIEMAYAQLRVDERARAYMCASGANVAMTVMFTIALVVFAEPGRARPAARQLRRFDDHRARAVVGAAQALLAARAGGGSARDAALRPADGAGRRERVRAAGGRSLLPLSRRGPRRPRASTRSRCSSPR